MQKNILGKYVPYNTFIHRLDSRMKIVSMILLIVAIFLPYKTYALNLTVSIFNLIVIFILMMISKVKIKDILFQLKSIWFMVILLLIINMFFPPKGASHILFQIKNFKVYQESLYQSIYIIIRLIAMFGIAAILTSSTSPQDLTYAFSFYLKPLKKIKFPSEEVAMTMSIALRFVPTLLEETERIYKAQSCRGIDFKHGNLKAKFKGIISLIIPLFVSAFSMSDELALALEARGYDPRGKRSSYKIHHWKTVDTICLIISVLYLTMFIVLSATGFDFIKLLFPQVW